MTMNIIQKLRDRETDTGNSNNRDFQAFEPFVERLELDIKLDGHEGCVNCIEFSQNGRILASASDDLSVFLWNPYLKKKITSFQTPHRGNIFSVNFLPKTNDQQIVTGAADKQIFAYDLKNTDEPIFRCRCHQGRVKRIACAPEVPSTFFTSSEDGRVHQIDLREKHECQCNDQIVLIDLRNHQEYAEVKCIAVNPRRPELIAIGANDDYARLYDRRMIKLMHTESENQVDNWKKDVVRYYSPGHLQASKEPYNKTITFVSFSPDGRELLVNYGAEQIYLFDIDKSESPVYLNLPSIDSKSAIRPPRKEVVENYKKSGNDYLKKKEYIKAIRMYSEAIQIDSDNPILYLNRATALMKRKYLGDCYEALRDCQKALKLDPKYVKAHFRLARALLEIKQLTLSSNCLQEFKTRFPDHENDQSVKMLEQDINEELQKKDAHNSRDSSIEKLSPNEIFWRETARDYSLRYIGHCNTKTDIKEANYFGQHGEYIVAGSDDGNFYIWDRKTTKLKSVYNADRAIVNCVQPHPFLPMIATSGIDHEIGIWSPLSEVSQDKCRIDNEKIDDLVDENQQNMQNDCYEFGLSTDNICRAS